MSKNIVLFNTVDGMATPRGNFVFKEVMGMHQMKEFSHSFKGLVEQTQQTQGGTETDTRSCG